MTSPGRYGTPYQASEALLAVVAAIEAAGEDGRVDYAHARAILRDMMPGELATLATAANELRHLAWDVRREKR